MAGMKGKLTLTFHKGRDMKETTLLTKADPYVKVWTDNGSEKFQTKVHENGGKNPVWEQSFIFNLTGKENVLHLHVWDKEVVSDNSIGRADINLKDLKYGKQEWYTIVDKDNFSKHTGALLITVTFDGTGGPAAAAPAAAAPAATPAAATPAAAPAASQPQTVVQPPVKPAAQAPLVVQPPQQQAVFNYGQPQVQQPAAQIMQPQYVAPQPQYVQPQVQMQPQVVMQPGFIQAPGVQVQFGGMVQPGYVQPQMMGQPVMMGQPQVVYQQQPQVVYQQQPGVYYPPQQQFR